MILHHNNWLRTTQMAPRDFPENFQLILLKLWSLIIVLGRPTPIQLLDHLSCVLRNMAKDPLPFEGKVERPNFFLTSASNWCDSKGRLFQCFKTIMSAAAAALAALHASSATAADSAAEAGAPKLFLLLRSKEPFNKFSMAGNLPKKQKIYGQNILLFPP